MDTNARAISLRKNQTHAEALLWYRLRDRRLGGHKFRRQLPIGPFIADFVCMSARLIVEVDGGQHAERRDYDEVRRRYLMERGFRVIRFWNNDVLQRADAVLESVLAAVEERLAGLGRAPR
jgi:very-short-patch-repair endonuclease